ncbi:diacylglycerol kinase family protein [Rapidithrix thailandica]|uniref:Diacylglycerol kinase family protein n=1 Tax=Rapidithrix thailandica TaxID=413964 RepID=A0AAW9S4U6_9BACT
MRKLVFIINPIAGNGKKDHLLNTIQEKLDGQKFRWEIQYTKGPKDATRIAKLAAAQGTDIVVAVGGDGTINEVAQGLVDSPACLGIVPMGSGNGLARHLQLPLQPEKAIGLLNQASCIQMDTCRVGKRLFLCTSGTGFEAKVSYTFSTLNGRGLWNYVRASLGEYFNYRPKLYTITIDGKTHKINAFSVTIANACQYGNNAFISPSANISDGLMDVCVIKAFPKFKALSLAYRLFNGTLEKSPYYQCQRGKKVRIECTDEHYLHYDGEPLKTDFPVDYTIQPKSLKVMCSAH